MTRPRPELCIALDGSDRRWILDAAHSLGGTAAWLKIGLEAFVAHGPRLVREVVELAVGRYETIQNNFSLLNRRFEDELANVCRREKVSLLPHSPLAGGVLSGKYNGGAWPQGARFSAYRRDAVRGAAMAKRFVNEKTLGSTERFAKIAAEAGLPVVTLAIAWSLAHDFVGSTIIGATRVDQLDDSLKAADVTLSADVLKACDAVSRDLLYPMG